MENEKLSARELLEKKKNEIKELEGQVKDEKAKEKEVAKKELADRIVKIEKQNITVKAIQKVIYAYNKLGKKAQAESAVLLKIGQLYLGQKTTKAEVQENGKN